MDGSNAIFVDDHVNHETNNSSSNGVSSNTTISNSIVSKTNKSNLIHNQNGDNGIGAGETGTSSEGEVVVDEENVVINLAPLHGLKVLFSFFVVVGHIQFILGFNFIVSTEPCMDFLRNGTFLGPILFELSWHMSMFWIVSGLLCEHSLRKLDSAWSKSVSANIDSNDDRNKNNDIHSCDDDDNEDIFNPQSSTQQQQQQQLLRHTTDSSTASNLIKTMSMIRRKFDWETICPQRYVQLITKRVIRFYPAYFVTCLFGYTFKNIIPHKFRDFHTLIRALLFMEISPFRGRNRSAFAGPLWSLNVDLHGYISAAMLAVICSIIPIKTNPKNSASSLSHHHHQQQQRKQQRKIKKYIIGIWYILAMMNMAYREPYPESRIKDEQALYDYIHSSHGGVELSKKDEFNTRSKTYPNYDFNSTSVIARREYATMAVETFYFTSVTGHGSAFLLGNLLYLNLLDRRWQPSKYWFLKILAAVLWLKATGMFCCFCGLPMYLILDVILTLKPSATASGTSFSNPLSFKSLLTIKARLSNAIYAIFCNPIAQKLSPYCYAICVINMLPIGLTALHLAPLRVDAVVKHGQDPCNAIPDGRGGYQSYGLQFIFFEAIKQYAYSALIAIVIYYMIDCISKLIKQRQRSTNRRGTEQIAT